MSMPEKIAHEQAPERGGCAHEKAFAKLNLSLDVLGKRPDGYHDLRMVMQSAALYDDVTVELTNGAFSAETNRSYIPGDEKNLAVKAALCFFSETGLPGGAHITLHKRIPVCAGLGGGSSDAAAVLRALNRLTRTELPVAALEEMAAKIGSDVPFCVRGGTVLAEGRGERLTPLPPLPDCSIVICMPGFTASTPELFARMDEKTLRCRPDTDGLIKALGEGSFTGVARRMYNMFEDVLDRRAAMLVAQIKGLLLDHGAAGALMSGTGSSVYGLFADASAAERARDAAAPLCRELFLVQSLPMRNILNV